MNLKEHGQAFSFYGDNADVDHWGGPKNGSGMKRLVDEGYFKIDKFDGKRIIIPTRKLLNYLLSYLNLD